MATRTIFGDTSSAQLIAIDIQEWLGRVKFQLYLNQIIPPKAFSFAFICLIVRATDHDWPHLSNSKQHSRGIIHKLGLAA